MPLTAEGKGRGILICFGDLKVPNCCSCSMVNHVCITGPFGSAPARTHLFHLVLVTQHQSLTSFPRILLLAKGSFPSQPPSHRTILLHLSFSLTLPILAKCLLPIKPICVLADPSPLTSGNLFRDWFLLLLARREQQNFPLEECCQQAEKSKR